MLEEKESSSALTTELREEIEKEAKENAVLVYMKGTPEQPQCGFSAKVIKILQSYPDVKIKAHDVLARSELREGIKEFNNWPTIPQIYIQGQFIGGCDIITQLHEGGELAGLLEVKTK